VSLSAFASKDSRITRTQRNEWRPQTPLGLRCVRTASTTGLHADRHASLHVYDTPERGWYCYGACRRGGTIYDLAAPLYGYRDRGEDFLRLRTELRRLFGLETA
jgi:hypothetical protein